MIHSTPAHSFLSFLLILNPFALCLYVGGVLEDLGPRSFLLVVGRASLLSLVIFALFVWGGEPLLVDHLGIQPAALRLFGGLLFVMVAYNYVLRGAKATEILRGPLDELPSAIALPYMIGAGTLTEAILLGKRHTTLMGLSIVGGVMLLSCAILLAFALIHTRMQGERERVFSRYLNILCRMNGLILGALSTQMVVESLRLLWESPLP